MSKPVTTLASIITQAHNQYGIRYQVKKQQLVDYANTIQYIAYNQDLSAFEEWGQVFILGQDVFLQTDITYSAPIESDIGLQVSGNTVGVVGKLMNFRTQNRSNKWIIEPPDGGPNLTLPDDEVLTIVGGSSASGVICNGQSFDVSSGPYRMPTAAAGNPPFRKFIGVTTVTDKQLFRVSINNSFDGFDDYGIFLNNTPGRAQNLPYRLDTVREHLELTLVDSQPPDIEQTEETCGPGGTTLNTSALRWIYYVNPPPITDVNDETSLVIPEQYRYEILYKGISRLADTDTYGDSGTIQEVIAPLCKRFWDDMMVQYQQFGRGSDWVSHGDNWDIYGLGSTSGTGNGQNRRYPYNGQAWN